MRIKIGRFQDHWRGNGLHVSFHRNGGWYCFAVRPFNWHFYKIRPGARPDLTRWYFGPFEVERVQPVARAIRGEV